MLEKENSADSFVQKESPPLLNSYKLLGTFQTSAILSSSPLVKIVLWLAIAMYFCKSDRWGLEVITPATFLRNRIVAYETS